MLFLVANLWPGKPWRRGTFLWGVNEQLEKFEIFTKMHFSKFCGIFKEGWYTMKRKSGDKNINHKSRVFLAIKSLTQPWAFESEWNNYMNKCIKLRLLSVLTVFYMQWMFDIKCLTKFFDVLSITGQFSLVYLFILSILSPAIWSLVKSIPMFSHIYRSSKSVNFSCV